MNTKLPAICNNLEHRNSISKNTYMYIKKYEYSTFYFYNKNSAM